MGMEPTENDFALEFSTWKWRSLQLRRCFLFPVMCIFFAIIWFVLVTNFYRNGAYNSPNSLTPWHYFVIGIGYFFLTFHLAFATFTLFFQWGVRLVQHRSMGWGLCMMVMSSWFSAMLVLSIEAVETWHLTEFERAQLVTALAILGPNVFHHLGFSLKEIRPMIILLSAPWVIIKQNIDVSTTSKSKPHAHYTFSAIPCCTVPQGLEYPFVLTIVMQTLLGSFCVIIQVLGYAMALHCHLCVSIGDTMRVPCHDLFVCMEPWQRPRRAVSATYA